jgi:Fe-S oxidoreductase
MSTDDTSNLLDKIYEPDLRSLLKRCYQCGQCSGVCQLSKVQKYPPSKIIQLILEGFEQKVLESGILWECLTCNQCLKDCPEKINFADIVRMARYKMRQSTNQNPEELIAHKGIYTTISEIMSQPYINPNRSLDWIPKGCKISDKGNILYFVGCIPFFNYEFDDMDSIAISTLQILCNIEKEPIVVFKDEICCGHDIYWGQGKLEEFINLARKNNDMFERAGVSTIVTACAECYRTFKVDYPILFEDFDQKFKVKHIIEYIYEMWKEGKIEFVGKNESEEAISFTYQDPCRLSRFLPDDNDNDITEIVREIFKELKKLGFNFKEMEHNKSNSLCCGVSSWMNCNEKSKALRYKRMLEAKSAGTMMITSCPKCKIHLSCVQADYEDISAIEILDFSEFLINHINVINSNKKGEEKK